MNTLKLLKNLEYFFLLLTVVCVGYIGYFFLTQHKTIDVSLPLPSVKLQELDSADETTQELRPYDFYAKQINGRDVFVAPKQVKTIERTGLAAGQLPVNFKVVGIVLANPAQVVIEDQTAHQTYFVSQDSPSNGISIKYVLKDKIVLEYQNQNIDIKIKGNQIDTSST